MGEINGMNEIYRAKSFVIETSEDNKKWKTVYEQRNNQDNTTEVDISQVKARYVRFQMLDNRTVAIADMEIYGSKL